MKNLIDPDKTLKSLVYNLINKTTKSMYNKTLAVERYMVETVRNRRSKDAEEHMEIGQELGWYHDRVTGFPGRQQKYFSKCLSQELGFAQKSKVMYLENVLECYNCALEKTLETFKGLKTR